MILSDTQIQEALERGEAKGGIRIEPFNPESLEPASYDLHVGDQAATSRDPHKVNIAESGMLILWPGDFAIVTTQEKIHFSAKHVGRFGLTSSYARKGLIATTGAQIDPGFQGRLLVGLTNLSTKKIVLPHSDKFLTLEMHELSRPSAKPYQGPYQGRDELNPEDIQAVMEREVYSLSEITNTLRALVNTVDGLKQTVDGLKQAVTRNERLMALWAGFILAGVAIIVSLGD